MAGDRRATMGNLIAHRDIEKVFPADEYSCVGIAGTAGIAVELVRLFQVELEHYEKIEGALLSLDGKANRLSTMIRGNLGLAMQGLAVVPLFAGFDLDRERGPDLLLRRHRRALRGARPPQRRIRLAVRPGVAEEAVAAATWRPRRPSPSPWRRSSTPRTTTPRPAAPTWRGGSSRSSRTVTGDGLPAGCPRSEIATAVAGRSDRAGRATPR